MKKILHICCKASDSLEFCTMGFEEAQMKRIFQVSKTIKTLTFTRCEFSFGDDANFIEELSGSRIHEIKLVGGFKDYKNFSSLLFALSQSEDVVRSLRLLTIENQGYRIDLPGDGLKTSLKLFLKDLGFKKVEIEFCDMYF